MVDIYFGLNLIMGSAIEMTDDDPRLLGEHLDYCGNVIVYNFNGYYWYRYDRNADELTFDYYAQDETYIIYCHYDPEGGQTWK